MASITGSVKERTSVLKKGTVVMAENVVRVRRTEFVYRLTIEPQSGIRRRGEKKDFYSVSVERLKGSEKRAAQIRDFTSDRATAERFYHLLSIGGVSPEHLEDVYADFMST